MRTINFKVSYEKLLSRLPALFAYVEIDEQGTASIVKATNGAIGNYGKIVADIDTKYIGIDYTCKDGGKVVVSPGAHSYRTLIDSYYKVVNDIKEVVRDNWSAKKVEYKKDGLYQTEEYVIEQEKSKYPFIQFMDKGIGLKYVGLSEELSEESQCGVRIKKTYPLAPDYIYLGEARKYYEEVVKMKKQLDFWKNHTKVCKDDRKYYVALQEQYEAMNGDNLTNALKDMIQEAEETANAYLGYADDYPKLNFNVNLTSTIKDLGLVTPYIQEWVAGQRYYDGDVVYYVDEYGYGMTWECRIANDTDVKKDQFGREYIEGYYDETTELIYFEDGSTQYGIDESLPKYWYPQTLNWLDENVKHGYWTEGGSTITVKGSCNSHLTQFRRSESYMNKSDQVEYPDPYTDWLWYYRKGTIVNLDAKYDELGNMTVLYGDEENESFYPRGIQAITNQETPCYDENKKDDENNGNLICDGNTALNLAVWGDVLTDIKAENNDDGETGTITFTYWLGVHLKADKDISKGDWYSVDDDGNYKYYFKNFQVDNDSIYGKNHGVKYTESYIYYKKELDNEKCLFDLKEGFNEKSVDVNFEDYILGKYDKDYDPTNGNEDSAITEYPYLLSDKFEFSSGENIYSYDIKIGSQFKQVQYIKTQYESQVDITHVDIEKTPLIRYDYYNGVSFQPSINDDVNIERGVTQAFEKYIKFSEVKTFEDLENYANGGFFIMSKEDIDLG